MKELNLYKIKELALKTRRRVFAVKELAVIINKPVSLARVYLNRLIVNGFGERVAEGIITFTDDDYVIATQLVEPSYLSFNPALYFHHLIQQIPAELSFVTTKQVKKKLKYKYFRLDKKLFFGYKRYNRDNSYVFIAEPEKAVIDLVYYLGFSETFLKDMLSKLDLIKLKKYIFYYKDINTSKAKSVLKIGDLIANKN